MEIGIGAADLLLEARRGSPPRSPELLHCGENRLRPQRRRKSPRDRRPRPRRRGQGDDSVEPSYPGEPISFDQKSAKAQKGEEGDPQEPVAETGDDEEVTASSAEGSSSRPVGSRLPEAPLPEPSRRSHRLHRGLGDAGSRHGRSRRAFDRFAAQPLRFELQRFELTHKKPLSRGLWRARWFLIFFFFFFSSLKIFLFLWIFRFVYSIVYMSFSFFSAPLSNSFIYFCHLILFIW